MNKRLLTLAVAGAFGACGSAFAVETKIGGYVESVFVVTQDEVDEGSLTNERRFDTEGSLSFRAMQDDFYAGVVLDVNSRYSGFDDIAHQAGGGSRETIEIPELWGGWNVNDMVGIRVGRMENPLGIESQKSPYKTTITRSLVTDILDIQTPDLYKNTIEGLVLDLNVGPAKVSLGALNELGGVQEENSFLAHVSGEVVPGLTLGLGMLTQEDVDVNEDSFENLINFNAAYRMDLGDMAAKLWVDYLTAGEILDAAWSVGANLQVMEALGVTFRYDMAEFDNNFEITSMTLAGNWRAHDRVDIRAEWRNDEFENGSSEDFDQVLLSAIFKY